MIDRKPNTTIRVSIVEDDEQLRSGMIVLLEGTHGFRCISAYEDGETAIKDIPQKTPDIVLMDINLPGISGIECVRRLKSKLPDMQFLMLTVYEDNNKIFQALQAGASGYLLKMSQPDELIKAIREVSNGGAPMSPQIARKVVHSFHTAGDEQLETPLSAREEDILYSLASGNTYKEIASELDISVDTVHNHLKKVYSKLHVRSRTEAVVKYLKR
ncbi:MAG: response regulator transcription factor [Ignavibacteriales bacterium]|nr:response regulator transcription factor [Ignavibacteriales bacterium]